MNKQLSLSAVQQAGILAALTFYRESGMGEADKREEAASRVRRAGEAIGLDLDKSESSVLDGTGIHQLEALVAAAPRAPDGSKSAKDFLVALSRFRSEHAVLVLSLRDAVVEHGADITELFHSATEDVKAFLGADAATAAAQHGGQQDVAIDEMSAWVLRQRQKWASHDDMVTMILWTKGEMAGTDLINQAVKDATCTWQSDRTAHQVA